MSKISIFLLLAYAIYPSSLWSQDKFQSKFASAESYIESGFFDLARNLLENVQPQTEPGSDEYRYCVDKIAHTYSLQWKEVMESPVASKKLTFLTSFLAHIEKEGEYLGNSLTKNRIHFIHEALVGEYFNMRNPTQARVYQEKLYDAHQQGILPPSIKEFYSIGKFSNGSISVYGYEWFEGVSAESDQGSYSKLVFSVYPANAPGKEDEELMQFHVKNVSWIDPRLGEYILVQRPGVSQSGQVVTLWDFSFDSPLDYLELREIIIMLGMAGDSRG